MTPTDRVAHYINVLVLPVVILVGVVVNILSILTWSCGTHRRTSTALLLTSLAVVDIAVLCMPALEFWTLETLELSLRNSHTVLCKLFSFSSFFAPTLSSWITVFVTFERLISMWLPVKVRYLCTRGKVAGFLILIAILLLALYFPFLTSWELVDKGTSTVNGSFNNVTSSYVCYTNSYDVVYIVYRDAWLWIDLCALFVAPFALIVLSNGLILTKIVYWKKFLHQGRCVEHRTRVANCFTVRAVAISIMFCLCTCPVTVYAVYRHYAGIQQPSKIGWVLTLILLYGNSCINFFLYCAIGSGFRTDLKTLFSNVCIKRTLQFTPVPQSSRKHSVVSNLLHLSKNALHKVPD